MARPLRIEFLGALYHVTSRGDRQEAIFDDDQDRTAFVNVLAEVILRFWLALPCVLFDGQPLPSHDRNP